jgi:hypothetical protein
MAMDGGPGAVVARGSLAQPKTLRSSHRAAEAIRCHALLRGRRGAQTCVGRGTTTVIGIGIFFSVIGLGYLCWTLFDLIVYTLPAIVGVTAGFAAYHSGAGALGAIIVAPIAGGLTLGVGKPQSRHIRRRRSARPSHSSLPCRPPGRAIC